MFMKCEWKIMWIISLLLKYYPIIRWSDCGNTLQAVSLIKDVLYFNAFMCWFHVTNGISLKLRCISSEISF
jgi:hypothetical protein